MYNGDNQSTHGSYYSAVPAMAGYYSSSGGPTESAGNVAWSICPRNWRLPTYAEYTSLRTAYKGSAYARAAFIGVGLHFPGYYQNSTRYQYTTDVYFMTSSNLSSDVTQVFNGHVNLNTQTDFDVTAYSKMRGISVRCVYNV